MKKRKIRWAASVYGRRFPVLRPIAQPILGELFDTVDVVLNWIDDLIPRASCKEVKEVGFSQQAVQEYSDRSRRNEAAAAVSITNAEYLGRYAIVMDTEILGICISWEKGHQVVALDSQGAICRA